MKKNILLFALIVALKTQVYGQQQFANTRLSNNELFLSFGTVAVKDSYIIPAGLAGSIVEFGYNHQKNIDNRTGLGKSFSIDAGFGQLVNECSVVYKNAYKYYKLNIKGELFKNIFLKSNGFKMDIGCNVSLRSKYLHPNYIGFSEFVFMQSNGYWCFTSDLSIRGSYRFKKGKIENRLILPVVAVGFFPAYQYALSNGKTVDSHFFIPNTITSVNCYLDFSNQFRCLYVLNKFAIGFLYKLDYTNFKISSNESKMLTNELGLIVEF